MRKFLLLLFSALVTISVHYQSIAQIPPWVIQDWEHRTQGEGIWIANNAKYKSQDESYEAYGLEWQWGLGKNSLTGRLYCILNGKDIRTAWTFLEFWDAEAKELRLVQVGSDGTVGQGIAWLESEGVTKSLQTFNSPNGSSFTSGHEAKTVNGDSHVSSFNVDGDQWTPRRSYIWKNTVSALNKVPTPEEFKDFEFLIGTWQVDIGDNRLVNMSFEWAQNKLMVFYKSTNPAKAGEPVDYEVRGMVVYHGVKEQLVFMSAYLESAPTLMNEGHFNFPTEGVIERIFTVFYKEGSRIPWTNGEVAPKGGQPVNFKQVWTKLDKDSFTGEFFWKKNGKWQHPYAKKGEEKELWIRVK